MNPVGIHFGYWAKSWNMDPLPLVGKVRTLGFDILEVNSFE